METTTIKVYRNGRPVKGIRVVLGFTFGHSKSFYTNADGIAYVQHSTRGNATLYADGRSIRTIKTPCFEVVYL